jgi:3-dehydroquinate synthase
MQGTVCDVRVGAHAYAVKIGPGLLAGLGGDLASLPVGKKSVLIADEAVAGRYGETVLNSLRAAGFEANLIQVPSGERAKDLSQAGPLLSFLARHQLDRHSPVIALGGGVTGDLAGFVAATYLRGVPLVQVPTTLLAMVDSSVGGKTGVNLPEGKNLVGSFHQPVLVVADTDTLQTLPPRELAAGAAEIIKYGVIADADLFQKVAAGLPENLPDIIRRCVEIKAEIVAADEKETTGLRALLNFGHTLGHAVEQAAGYGEFLHGEAVAVGMRAAAHLSRMKLGLSETEVSRIEQAIVAHHLPLRAPGLNREKIYRAMKLDKKAASGVNRWVLSPKIGEARVCADVTEAEVEAVMDLCLNE